MPLYPTLPTPLVHTKGSQNPSDFLSRHTSRREPKREEKRAEDYVNLLCLHAVPKAMTLTELKEATKADLTLCELMTVVRSGTWYEAKSEELKQFAKVKDDVTVNAEFNLILCGSRIVIPTSLQQRAIDIAHEGNQRMVKTKRLLREKVWFPGIEDKVKKNHRRLHCMPSKQPILSTSTSSDDYPTSQAMAHSEC